MKSLCRFIQHLLSPKPAQTKETFLAEGLFIYNMELADQVSKEPQHHRYSLFLHQHLVNRKEAGYYFHY